MFKRIAPLSKNQHFFLFGARGTGKSSLIQHDYNEGSSLWIDLLNVDDELEFSRDPMSLEAIVLKLPESTTHVVIDEIQKVPSLLDVVHRLIENKAVSQQFILTGSSARKLKRGGANLLAGRAFVYHLFPLTFLELGQRFNTDEVLQWGALPRIYQLEQDVERRQFLTAYAHTYLKEEIWAEQLIKNLEPFQRFLEVAAQSNGKIINYTNIARDVGVNDKTVKEYYQLLEDTLVGFYLYPFKHSFRKRLGSKPKFYFFDMGVTRALARLLTLPIKAGTSYYGELFEQLVLLECMKLADYHQLDYHFSYLKTQGGVEVDLVVDRPGKPYLFIEIKSGASVGEDKLRNLQQLASEFGDCEALCFSQDPRPKQFGEVSVLPWQQGIIDYFSEGTAA